MPKLKTIKAISKRVKVTGKKKFLLTAAGQDHFRSRQSGAAKMGRRRYKNLADASVKNMKRALPYS